jgi:hypothetical protein
MPRAKKAAKPSTQGGPSRQTLPTGLPYGENIALQRAQAATPSGPAPAPPTGPAPEGGGGPPNLEELAQAQPGNEDVRGHPTPISRPTERPGEPVTAGLPTGPGPGPEAIQPLRPPDPLTQAAATLNQLGATADPATRILRDRVNASLKGQVAP